MVNLVLALVLFLVLGGRELMTRRIDPNRAGHSSHEDLHRGGTGDAADRRHVARPLTPRTLATEVA